MRNGGHPARWTNSFQLSCWLEAETAKPRKQRPNLKQIHEDLKELGYEGSYDRVAAFARQWKAGQSDRGNSASKRTGITQSTLSQTVRALERKLNLKLLNRTTRSVSPHRTQLHLPAPADSRWFSELGVQAPGAEHACPCDGAARLEHDRLDRSASPAVALDVLAHCS
jgi:hypothetical protein